MITINNIDVDFGTLLKCYKNDKYKVAKNINELTGAPVDYVMKLLEDFENGVPISPVINIEPEVKTVKINNVDIDLDELLQRHKANSVEAATELYKRTGISIKKAFRILENYEKGIPIRTSTKINKETLLYITGCIAVSAFIITSIITNLDKENKRITSTAVPTNTPVTVAEQTPEPTATSTVITADADTETPEQTPKATKKPKKTSKPKKTKKPKKRTKHRKGDDIIGISNKNVYDTGIQFSPRDIPNDTTGDWKVSTIADNIDMQDYALSYYKRYFMNKNEVHAIVNFNYMTTTCIKYMNGMLILDTYDYVKGEEHDANLLFSGTHLKQVWVYTDNGDIEFVSY